MSTKRKDPPAGAAQPAAGGQINIDDMVANQVRSKVDPKLLPAYDKVVLSGMRIMFDASSHQMTLDALEGEGPMEQKLSTGVISLMYMLWEKSKKSIPPQVIVPVTLTLALRAFQFLQESNDPEATPEVLGEATAQAVQGVMDRFGATQDKLPALLKSQGGKPAAGAPAAPGAQLGKPSGMLGAGGQ